VGDRQSRTLSGGGSVLDRVLPKRRTTSGTVRARSVSSGMRCPWRCATSHVGPPGTVAPTSHVGDRESRTLSGVSAPRSRTIEGGSGPGSRAPETSNRRRAPSARGASPRECAALRDVPRGTAAPPGRNQDCCRTNLYASQLHVFEWPSGLSVTVSGRSHERVVRDHRSGCRR